MDGDGNDVAAGVSGEILLRGGSVMLQYLDDPESTAATLSSDGWLRTGDLATIDDRGNIKIVGRAKDMYIVGGFNVYPAEVEDLLLRHPGYPGRRGDRHPGPAARRSRHGIRRPAFGRDGNATRA